MPAIFAGHLEIVQHLHQEKQLIKETHSTTLMAGGLECAKKAQKKRFFFTKM